jgi:hypothetical protein
MLIEDITLYKLSAYFLPLKSGFQTELPLQEETINPEELHKFMASMKNVIKNLELRKYGKI